MRFTSLLAAVPFLSSLALAADPAHWSKLASKSRDGVIKLDSKTYEDILALDREYSVTVLLTAIPAQYKCQPCQCVHLSSAFSGLRLSAVEKTPTEVCPELTKVFGYFPHL